jgi:hypothetical protein
VHKIRTIVILGVLWIGAIAALYYGLRWFGRELRDKPYVANVKTQLRSLVAAEEAYRRDSLSYTSEVARVWHASAETRGVEFRILEAGADGFLAEGRHDSWVGRCVIAVGRSAGDSLPVGEPVCLGGATRVSRQPSTRRQARR